MYQNFYGLNQLPFDSALDGSCFFAGGQRQEILDALLYFTERGEKMVVVTGESGVGKTALIAALQLRLPERISRVQLTGPYLMQQELQEALLSYLSIKIELGEDKSSTLTRYLEQLANQSAPLLLIVDDAHKLSQASLGFLLSLAGVTSSLNQPLVQLMLFGMPDLSKMLVLLQETGTPDPAAFRARLNAFSVDELFFYLEQRLRCAGYQGESLFDPAVIKAIFAVTKGIPRSVNGMVDQLLMSCYAKGSRIISLEDIHALGYHTQAGFANGFSYENDQSILQTLGNYLTKPPIVITLITSVVVGLSLLAGYVISDYLMINHSTKEEIGKSAIINSMSIDPPMPASIMPTTESANSLLSTSELPPTTSSANLNNTPSSTITNNTAEAQIVKTATPPAKSLQSEPLPKTASTPPSNTNNIVPKTQPSAVEKTSKTEVAKTEPSAQKLDTTKQVPLKTTPDKPAQEKPIQEKAVQEKPIVTQHSATVSTVTNAVKWPINGNWKKHHDETLAQLKRLKNQGATHTIQLLSDTWRSRDAFIGLTHHKLNALPEQTSAHLVDYQLEDGRPRIALVYGAYSGIESAQSALKSFPEEVAKYHPMLKRLDSVISQMEGFHPPDL